MAHVESHNKLDASNLSFLVCQDFDRSYEVVRLQMFIWKMYLRAYARRNVNKFISTLIEGNTGGYRKIRAANGEHNRQAMPSKIRSPLQLLGQHEAVLQFDASQQANAIENIRKRCYVWIEKRLARVRKQGRMDDEVVYPARA